MVDRTRERRGAHASVGGAPADETLDDLVAQFADRHAFVRELIQNSLDAGAATIEVAFDWSDGLLKLSVIDDGEGMDRATIEGYLLTLFRSTKEQDRTKIGKFGIGFVSLFAMEPEQVVVTTGRDLVTHRVTFDADRAWTLEELDELFEGTRVTLHLRRRKRKDAEATREKVLQAAHRWCRFARAEVVHTSRGVVDAPQPTPIEGVFAVDAPVSVVLEEDGLRAVLGPSRAAHPPVGFVSGGLTLWEGALDAVPGVTFLVEGRHLGHTLTRDNVRRDRAFEHALERLRVTAVHRLRGALESALRDAAIAGDGAAIDALLEACRVDGAHGWSDDVAWVPAWPEPVTLGHVRRRLARPRIAWFGSREPCYCAREGSPLVEALAARHLVLRSSTGGPVARFVAEVTGATPWGVDAFGLATVTDARPEQAGALAVVGRLLQRPVRGGELHGAWGGRLAAPHADGRPVDAGEVRPEGDAVVVASDHRLWRALGGLPDAVAGPLLAHAVLAELGDLEPVSTELAVAALDAVEAG